MNKDWRCGAVVVEKEEMEEVSKRREKNRLFRFLCVGIMMHEYGCGRCLVRRLSDRFVFVYITQMDYSGCYYSCSHIHLRSRIISPHWCNFYGLVKIKHRTFNLFQLMSVRLLYKCLYCICVYPLGIGNLNFKDTRFICNKERQINLLDFGCLALFILSWRWVLGYYNIVRQGVGHW